MTRNPALSHPLPVVIFLLVLIGVFAGLATGIETDTRPNAFLASDNPALVYRDKVRDTFGLSDPLIIALVDNRPEGAFTPGNLATLKSLHEKIADLPNIDENRVISLASEKNIIATEEGMEITPFLEDLPKTQGDADNIRQAVMDFPLLRNNLVSDDGQAVLIVAELRDEMQVEDTYEQVRLITDSASSKDGAQIHVAGEGAIAGYLARYIDMDAKKLNPLAWLLIMAILYLAYRRFWPIVIANVVIAASAAISLGLMAALDIPFYMITTALPVILIGISVADTIHIYSHFFELQARKPEAEIPQLVEQTLREMWRPVTLTTLTTMAGFLGLYFSAHMPPFKYFGLFAAIGVAAAWLYSLVLLPAAIVLTKPKVHPAVLRQMEATGTDRFGAAMRSLGRFTERFAVPLMILAVLIAILGSLAASRVIVDEEPITIFHPSEPLYQADKAINRHLAGTNALDIVIETPQPEGLLLPENLRRIEALQEYAAGLPHVGGSTSIVDYLKQMNRALNGGDASQYALPASEELAAQYFLIYSATSDSTDFEEEIDYDFQMANVRLNLDTGSYDKFKPVVEDLQVYLDEHFNSEELKATLSGRVNLNYHWIGDLGRSHFAGLGVALLLVWVVSSLLFRSFVAGVYTLIPVAGAILLVYAVMATLNLGLGVGTSMFAAVALGLGVDFSIHTIERLKVIYAQYSGDWPRVFEEFYQTTGRALFFNFLAIGCGFGILMSSQVGSLNNFGIMIVVAITTSFFASMTLLPAMLRHFEPRFVVAPAADNASATLRWRLLGATLIATAIAWLLLMPGVQAENTQSQPKSATEAPSTQEDINHSPVTTDRLSAEEVVQRVNAADDGQFVTRQLQMELVDRRGKTRTRDTIVYRKDYAEEMRTIVFYTSPSNVRNTAFLTLDYNEPSRDDDQWLYLPAMRKVRRISAADRGDYFMGTDFTYEDIKLDGKLSEDDYTYELIEQAADNEFGHYRLSATARDEETAKELGYSKIEFLVDPDNWLVVQGEYIDPKGEQLKTLSVTATAEVDGIWTRESIELENHQSGHRTIFLFSHIDYQSPIQDDLFSKRAMERGAP